MAHAGADASIFELADSIHAAQIAEYSDEGSTTDKKVLINIRIVIKLKRENNYMNIKNNYIKDSKHIHEFIRLRGCLIQVSLLAQSNIKIIF